MPPPPPSASYLWKFDDLTDDDDDGDSSSGEEEHEQQLPKCIKPSFGMIPSSSPLPTKNTLTTNPKMAPSSDPRSSTSTPVVLSTALSSSKVSVKTSSSSSNSRACSQTSATSTNRTDSSSQHAPIILAPATNKTSKTSTLASTLPLVISAVVSDDDEDSKQDGYDHNIVVPPPAAEEISMDEEDDTFLLNDGDIVDDPATAVAKQTSSSSSRKRKKNKKKKSRNKGSSNNATATATTSLDKKNRSVSFAHVHIHSFPRCLGVSGVPGNGGWPLGMTLHSEDRRAPDEASLGAGVTNMVAIDDYENAKQERLIQRIQEQKQQQQSGSSSESLRIDHGDKKASTVLETRQWDYKSQCRNPLFGSLIEKERMQLLLESSSARESEGDDVLSVPSKQHQRVGRNNSHNSTCGGASSNVQGNQNNSSHSSSNNNTYSSGDHYNDEYTDVEVRHVRNELEQIRNNRTMDGAIGCTCRKLQVYILPKGQAAGKKAHHRRMKPSKVKEELRKRQLLPPEEVLQQYSREALEGMLHDAVELEPCCTPNSGCSCVRNGIECQADTCSCWHISHQTTSAQQHHTSDNATLNSNHGNQSSSSDSTCSMADIKARCGNPINGMYVVDFAKIDEFRRNVLCTLNVCPEIKVHS